MCAAQRRRLKNEKTNDRPRPDGQSSADLSDSWWFLPCLKTLTETKDVHVRTEDTIKVVWSTLRGSQRKELKTSWTIAKADSIDWDVFCFFVTITFLAAPPAAASSQLSTQALCEPWPRLPTQHRARVGGLMEYGSNWPPIQSCGLQVSLSSERTQMDAHILKVSLQFSHFALGLFGCVARTVVAPLLCTFVSRDKIWFHRYPV